MNNPRIAWKCRRGMLELDLIFHKFYEQQFDCLTEKQKQDFDRLLDEPDPILAAWLFGTEAPSDPDFQSIISKMIFL